ncbi:MAG TPA: hypothetical protein VIM89_18150 [Mucilaginibacter sp.]
MKKIILLTLLFLPSISFSQVSTDSLYYYSYLIFKTDRPFRRDDFKPGFQTHLSWGTCFFIRVKERLFLITASHVVNNEKESSTDIFSGIPNIHEPQLNQPFLPSPQSGLSPLQWAQPNQPDLQIPHSGQQPLQWAQLNPSDLQLPQSGLPPLQLAQPNQVDAQVPQNTQPSLQWAQLNNPVLQQPQSGLTPLQLTLPNQPDLQVPQSGQPSLPWAQLSQPDLQQLLFSHPVLQLGQPSQPGLQTLDLFSQEPKLTDIEVRYYDDSTKRYDFFVIDYKPKDIIQTKNSFLRHPDIEIIEIKDLPKHAVIYSIEDFVFAHRKKPTKVEGVVFWGFPQDELNKFQFLYNTPENNSLLNESNLYTGKIARNYNLNYIYNNVDSLNLVLNPKTAKGASGSPVFFINSQEEKKKKVEWFEFAGLEFAIDEYNNLSFVVKASEILKLLNEKINQ